MPLLAETPDQETLLKEAEFHELWNALQESRPTAGYTPDKTRQEKALRMLIDGFHAHDEKRQTGADLVEYMYAHLQGRDAEAKLFTKHTGRASSSVDYRTLVKSELLELLVSSDPRLNKLMKETEDSEEADQLARLRTISQELLSIAHDPYRCDYGDLLRYMRNPDAVIIELSDDGRVHVTAVGEAKAGEVDDRALHQMDVHGGFRTSLQTLTFALGSRPDLAEHGLVALAEAKTKAEKSGRTDFLVVDSDARQVVYVPAEKDPKDKESFLTKRIREDELSRNHALEILQDVTFSNAAFSTSELYAITDHLVRKMSERYETFSRYREKADLQRWELPSQEKLHRNDRQIVVVLGKTPDQRGAAADQLVQKLCPQEGVVSLKKIEREMAAAGEPPDKGIAYARMYDEVATRARDGTVIVDCNVTNQEYWERMKDSLQRAASDVPIRVVYVDYTRSAENVMDLYPPIMVDGKRRKHPRSSFLDPTESCILVHHGRNGVGLKEQIEAIMDN